MNRATFLLIMSSTFLMFNNSTSAIERRYFTDREDKALLQAIEKYPDGSWTQRANFVNKQTRRKTGKKFTAKQCNDRYNKHLKHANSGLPWTEDEDRLLLEKVKVFGCKWTEIFQFFDKRSPNNVKNRYVILKRKSDKKDTDPEKQDIDQLMEISHGKTETDTSAPAAPAQPEENSLDLIDHTLKTLPDETETATPALAKTDQSDENLFDVFYDF